MLKVSDVIGDFPKLDHFELGVQRNRMIYAISFFVHQLGWIELADREVDGDWGYARFLVPTSGSAICVQLTELVDDPEEPIRSDHGHLGLKVSDPSKAAEAIVAWAHSVGLKEIEVEPVPGNKRFVYLWELFKSGLELVPR